MKSREDRSKQFFDVDLDDGYVPDEIDAIYEKVSYNAYTSASCWLIVLVGMYMYPTRSCKPPLV